MPIRMYDSKEQCWAPEMGVVQIEQCRSQERTTYVARLLDSNGDLIAWGHGDDKDAALFKLESIVRVLVMRLQDIDFSKAVMVDPWGRPI